MENLRNTSRLLHPEVDSVTREEIIQKFLNGTKKDIDTATIDVKEEEDNDEQRSEPT